jgi:hypothetical protein
MRATEERLSAKALELARAELLSVHEAATRLASVLARFDREAEVIAALLEDLHSAHEVQQTA